MALEVIRKSVALSLTDLILVAASEGFSSCSSSLRDRWRAAPCLVIRSLHVLRSSNLAFSVRKVFCSSFLSGWPPASSSSSSEENRETLHEFYGLYLLWGIFTNGV